MNCKKLILNNVDGTPFKIFEIGNFYENDPTTIIDSIYVETYSYQSGSKIVLWVGKFSKPIEKISSMNYIKLGSSSNPYNNDCLNVIHKELFYYGSIFTELK